MDEKDIITNEQANQNIKIVKTDVDSHDGQNKCPKCGATDISTNTQNGKLRCNFCRYEFEPEKITGMEENIKNLEGQIIGSGAQDIVADTKDILTFKCSSCGAEVVIDTSSQSGARCHWCRNTLSVNQQIPNGSVPDVVLPFTVSKENAKTEIEKFVGKRKFYAHPKFRQEFTTNNIMGVYFPYMIVDVNAHAKLIGQGEHKIREYTVGSDNNRRTYYDADLYHVERDFDITINGLSIESNSDRLNINSKEKTNNIINSIMPFDIENCVKYNANYLKGYTSERRDTNIEQLKTIVDTQAKDIARYAANDTLGEYDRGVAWDNEQFDIKGQQWRAAYLPVWLYSYQEVKKDKKLLHYVAVNARTKETMGSVPIHMPKLLLISFLIEIIGLLLMLFVDWDYSWLFLSLGIIYFLIIHSKYRNTGARHSYETQTEKDMRNLKSTDDFIKTEKGLSNSMIEGANNKRLEGNSNRGLTNKISSLTGNDKVVNFIKNNIDNRGGK